MYWCQPLGQALGCALTLQLWKESCGVGRILPTFGVDAETPSGRITLQSHGELHCEECRLVTKSVAVVSEGPACPFHLQLGGLGLARSFFKALATATALLRKLKGVECALHSSRPEETLGNC